MQEQGSESAFQLSNTTEGVQQSKNVPSENQSPPDEQGPSQEFQFVQVGHSGKPEDQNLKTAVRANARRFSKKEKQHSKQRPSPRQLLRKTSQNELAPQFTFSDSESTASSTVDSRETESHEMVLSRQKSSLPSSPGQDSESSFSPLMASQRKAIMPGDSNLYFPPSQSSSGPSKEGYESQPLQNFDSALTLSHSPQPSQWQSLNRPANTPYTSFSGDEAPGLSMQAKRWPFAFPLRSANIANNTKFPLWMPELGVPLMDTQVGKDSSLKAAKPTSRNLEFYTYKGEILQWVSNQLEDQSKGTSDETIGVIMCLVMWEIAHSNTSEAVQHMKGIQRIVNIRGGIDGFESNSHLKLKILLSVTDAFAAVVTNSGPQFPVINFPNPAPAPSKITGLDIEPVLNSPLYGKSDLEIVFSKSPFSSTSIRIMQLLRKLTVAKISGAPLDDMLQTLNAIFSLPESSNRPSETSKAVFHASLIYSRVFLCPPVPFSSATNSASLTILVEEMESPANDKTWLLYPGVFLWILLTAILASEGKPERVVLTQIFGNVVSLARWGWWREVLESIMTFLEIRQHA